MSRPSRAVLVYGLGLITQPLIAGPVALVCRRHVVGKTRPRR